MTILNNKKKIDSLWICMLCISVVIFLFSSNFLIASGARVDEGSSLVSERQSQLVLSNLGGAIVQGRIGDNVTLRFMAVNNCDKEVYIYNELLLPHNWQPIIFNKKPFRLAPKESRLIILSIRIPNDASAEEHSISLIFKDVSSDFILSQQRVKVKVMPEVAVACSLSEFPKDILAGMKYNPILTIYNSGNVTVDLSVDYSITAKTSVEGIPEKVTISAGESMKIPLTVVSDNKIISILRSGLSIKIINDFDGSVLDSAYSYTMIYPSQNTAFSSHHSIRSNLKISANNYDFRVKDEVSVELSGNGNIDADKKLQYYINSTQRDDRRPLFNNATRAYIKYDSVRYNIDIGDISFRTSPLTGSRSGRGFSGGVRNKQFSFQGCYLENRPNIEKTHQLLPEYRAVLTYNINPENIITINAIKSEDVKENHFDFDMSGKYICSINGEFNDFNKRHLKNLSLEYGCSAPDGLRCWRTAYRTEAKGELPCNIDYTFLKIMGQPMFLGEYSNKDIINTSLRKTFKNNIQANINWKRDVDHDSTSIDSMSVPKQNIVYLRILAPIKTGFRVSGTTKYTYCNKVSSSDADLKYKQTDYSMRLEWNLKKYRFSNELEYGEYQDITSNMKKSLQKYRCSASYTPTKEWKFELLSTAGHSSFNSLSPLWAFEYQGRLLWTYSKDFSFRSEYKRYYRGCDYKSDNINSNFEYKISDSRKLRLQAKYYKKYIDNDISDKDFKVFLQHEVSMGMNTTMKRDFASVRGLLYYLDNGKKVPISDLIVKLGSRATITDKNGIYHFVGLKPGDYDIYADSNQAGFITEKKIPVTVFLKGGSETNIDIKYIKSASVSGKMSFVNNDPSIMTESGMAVDDNNEQEVTTFPGSIIFLQSIDDKNIYFQTVVENNGEFSFINVRPGKWKIVAWENMLPKYFYIKNNNIEVDILPGKQENILIEVKRKQRIVKMLQPIKNSQ